MKNGLSNHQAAARGLVNTERAEGAKHSEGNVDTSFSIRRAITGRSHS